MGFFVTVILQIGILSIKPIQDQGTLEISCKLALIFQTQKLKIQWKPKISPENEIHYMVVWRLNFISTALVDLYLLYSHHDVMKYIVRSGYFNKSLSGFIIMMIRLTLNKLQSILNVYMLIHQLKNSFIPYNTPGRQVLFLWCFFEIETEAQKNKGSWLEVNLLETRAQVFWLQILYAFFYA